MLKEMIRQVGNLLGNLSGNMTAYYKEHTKPSHGDQDNQRVRSHAEAGGPSLVTRGIGRREEMESVDSVGMHRLSAL